MILYVKKNETSQSLVKSLESRVLLYVKITFISAYQDKAALVHFVLCFLS